MSWKVYKKDGITERCEIRQLTYDGAFMGERSVTFTVTGPDPVGFEIGDFLSYRNEVFSLYYIPAKEKVASRGSYGEAFRYQDVKFMSLGYELTLCSFLDYVMADNEIHYSGLPKFSFYASGVGDLARRIQANLNRIYQGENAWTIIVNPALENVEMNIDVADLNCFDALGLVNEKWKLFFTITGRTVSIGYDLDALPTEFTYKDAGLYSIKQDTKSDTKIITRLKAIGGTRNMPYRYYNGKGNVPDGMYCPNLMLPGFINSGGEIYIESANKAVYGIREATVYFDGSDGREDVHPTIENMSADTLRSLGYTITLPTGDNGKLDEILKTERMPTDNGVLLPEDEDDAAVGDFVLILKDIGFDPSDHLSPDSAIAMNSGMCIGREFTITKCRKDTTQGYTQYVLTCKRSVDSDLNIAFPNISYTIRTGDRFVLLNISMPEAYIDAASARLLEVAREYLGEHDKFRFTFEPKIWRGYLPNRQLLADLFIEGKLMPVKDTDLDIEDTVPIQVLTIKEGEDLLPFYEVTLSEDLVYSKIQQVADSVERVQQEVINNNNDITRYLKRRWQDIKETQKELEKELLTGFTNSISPLTIQAMQGFFGSEQLQFIFVDSKTEPQHPVSNIPQYDNTTGVLTCQVAILKHLTLGIDTVSSSHAAAEYKYWDIPAMTTNSLPTNGLLRLYVRCSKSDTTGEYILTEDVLAIDQESGAYHFLMGYLTSSFDGERSWGRLYGFTEILPGQITTDIIQDPFARMVIDLVNAKITARDGAEIIGKVTFDSGSSGYNNIVDKPDFTPYDDALSYINILPGMIDRLQAQIDDQIESWFYHYDPTLSNIPASDWTTSEDREKHLDDTFTNLDSGQSWRFTKSSSNIYSWTLMADTAASQALVLAGQAKDTADGKRRVFVNTPYPPYDIGDLWVQGAAGDIMRCRTARQTGSYVAADWEKASKYTDDSAALAAIDRAVQNLNTYINGSFADGIVSEAEAVGIEKYLNVLAAEKANVDAGYTALYNDTLLTGTAKSNLSSAKSTLDTRYTSLVNAINTAIADGKATSAEKSNVNTAYVNYRNALSTYAARYGEAQSAITSAVNNNITTARNEMAQKLGYSSYNDLVAAAAAGNTIITGGHIRTSLIEAEAIVTKALEAGIILSKLAYIENLIVDRIMSGKDDSLPRLTAKDSEIGFYLNKSAESSNNALVRIGTDVGVMQAQGGQRPGIVTRAINGDGKYAELTSAGLFVNGGKITGVSAISGITNAFSIAALLQERISGSGSNPSVNAAVFGWDQSETNYNNPNAIPAFGFGGYFNKLYTAGLYCSCRRLTQSDSEANRVIQENDVFISMYNTSSTTIFLPLPQTAGKIIFVRINNNATVTINAYVYSFSKHIMLPSGSIVDANDARTRGELVTLFWDGQYWLWNTTVQ